MNFVKVNDHTIAVEQKIKADDVCCSSYLVRVYDFLNLEVVTFLHQGDTTAGPVKSFSELDSLEGARRAYNELRNQGGDPPEIIFPDYTDRINKSMANPYDLSGHQPRYTLPVLRGRKPT